MTNLRAALEAMLRLFDDQGNMTADFTSLQSAINSGYEALTAAPPTAAAPQADPPQITMADVRKHVGGGMVSSDDVISAVNVLLRERWQPQDDAEPVAWQWNNCGNWYTIDKREAEDPEAYARRMSKVVRPIYTAPPSQAADRMREAYSVLCEPRESQASDNLEGALYDIIRLAEEGKPADKVCIRTIERVLAQLVEAETALSHADDGKKSEGGKLDELLTGVTEANLYPGFQVSPIRPSDPTPADIAAAFNTIPPEQYMRPARPDRREAIARIIDRLNKEGDLVLYETAEDRGLDRTEYIDLIETVVLAMRGGE